MYIKTQKHKDRISKTLRRYTCNHNYFDIIDSEDKAYWLGFIMADGYICKHKEGNNALVIQLKSTDKKHLSKFLYTLQSNHQIKIYPCGDKHKYFGARIYIRSKPLTDSLSKYGIISNKSLITKLPLLKKNLIKPFIRGLFDGDGSLSFNNSNKLWTFSLEGTKELLLSVQDLLIKDIGLNKTKLYQKNGTKSFSLRYCGTYQIKRIIDYIYSNSTIYLDRKYNAGRNLQHLFLAKCLEEQAPINCASNPSYQEPKAKRDTRVRRTSIPPTAKAVGILEVIL